MSAPIQLPEGWGEAWLHEAGDNPPKNPATVRSYDSLGRQLVWRPPTTFKLSACDIESRTGRPASWLAMKFGLGEEEFLRRWVLAEVHAKIRRVPILAWLKGNDLAGSEFDGIRFCVRATGSSFMAFGSLSSTEDPNPELIL